MTPYREEASAFAAEHVRHVETAGRVVRARHHARVRPARREPVRRRTRAGPAVAAALDGIVAGLDRAAPCASSPIASCRQATSPTLPPRPVTLSSMAPRRGCITVSTPVMRRGATWPPKWRGCSASPARLEPIMLAEVQLRARAPAVLRAGEPKAGGRRFLPMPTPGRRCAAADWHGGGPEPSNHDQHRMNGTMAQAGHHHRHHRAGRVVPRRAAARKGLRGRRHGPPVERAELLAHRAPARSHHAQAGRPARSAVADAARRGRAAARVLQPRGDVVRAGVVGSADADRRVQRAGRHARARGHPPGRSARSASIRPRRARCSARCARCRRPS